MPNSNVLITWDGHFNLCLIGLKASDEALEEKKYNAELQWKHSHQGQPPKVCYSTCFAYQHVGHLAKPNVVLLRNFMTKKRKVPSRQGSKEY